MICNYCNNQNKESSKYCAFCGHKLENLNVSSNQNVKLKLSNNNEEVFVNLDIPSIYKYNMSGKALMVSNGIEIGQLVGFYLFIFADFDNLDPSKFHTTHKSKIIETYEDFIMNHKVKVHVTKYEDDTVNMSFAIKVNESICGVVDIQKFGAKSKNDYTFNEIEPFFNILVNAKIEKNEQEKLSDYPTSNVNPDVILSDLKSLASTEKIVLATVVFFILLGIVCLFIFDDYIIILIGIFPMVLMFLGLFAAKRYKNMKYTGGVDIEHVKQDIVRNCISYPNLKTYFTDNYIITNHYHGAIVKYDDIIWVYPVNKYVNGVQVGTDLVVCLKLGKKISIPENSDIFKIIYNHNPNILFGYNRENKVKYKQLKNQ